MSSLAQHSRDKYGKIPTSLKTSQIMVQIVQIDPPLDFSSNGDLPCHILWKRAYKL